MASVAVVPYCPDWPREYERIVAKLKPQIEECIVRIDHIGSTSVPGLAAKDVIDIQIAVPELSDSFRERMVRLGYIHHPHLTDNVPGGADPEEFRKQVFTEPAGMRRANVHVRRIGTPNMRRALLFRDYLRAHPKTAAAHGLLKQRLAQRHPEDRDFYYAIKDPVTEMMWEAAEYWATAVGWSIA